MVLPYCVITTVNVNLNFRELNDKMYLYSDVRCGYLFLYLALRPAGPRSMRGQTHEALLKRGKEI